MENDRVIVMAGTVV
ncbi:hypothetical protein A2U01_0070800, partial [Trifolium medium]|nr:hypothetical protein [Trifolium medium]